MKAFRTRVNQFDASVWVKKFVEFFHDVETESAAVKYLAPMNLLELIPTNKRLVLFLDYDGTLFPIVRIPQLAAPDAPLLRLLKRMVDQPDIDVHLVSGRSSVILDQWFKDLGLHLHAEHGAMSKLAGETCWSSAMPAAAPSTWQPFVRTILQNLATHAPGSFIEDKAHSLAWHYRMTDPSHGERVANELRLHGRETFAPLGLEMLPGKRVIEIRHVGINKGMVVARVMHAHAGHATALAIGDDVTDEDMFSSMPTDGLGVAVGGQQSRASLRVRDPAAVRRFLELLSSPSRPVFG